MSEFPLVTYTQRTCTVMTRQLALPTIDQKRGDGMQRTDVVELEEFVTPLVLARSRGTLTATVGLRAF